MPTPYVTPEMIINAPTGLAWNIIPQPGSSSEAQYAEQLNICWRATGITNVIVNQVLRSTVDTEQQTGPDFRATIQNNAANNTRLILQRWPITDILQVAVSPNTFPRTWSTVPTGYYGVEHPILGVYGSTAPSSAGEGGQSILISSGFSGWGMGRNGYTLSVTYLNGWPHCGITTTATSGSTTLNVDDVTGFTGASVWIYDGAISEMVTVRSVTANTPLELPFGGTTPAGPGTLILTTPTLSTHATDIVVSAMPADILQAVILICAAQVMEAGITSISIQSLPGVETMGGHGVQDLMVEAEVILSPYKRVI